MSPRLRRLRRTGRALTGHDRRIACCGPSLGGRSTPLLGWTSLALVLLAVWGATPAAAQRRPAAPATPAANPATAPDKRRAAPPSPKAQPPAAPTAASMRLPAGVRPTAAELALTIDPAQTRFSGTVAYDLALEPPTAPPPRAGSLNPQYEVVLHARGLKIEQAWAEVGAQKWPAKVSTLDAERIVLRFARPLGPRARVGLQFSGQAAAQGDTGLIRRRDGRPPETPGSAVMQGLAAQGWMAVTNLQPNHARTVFPAFDEPGFKLPWTVQLTVPLGLQALANMPPAAPAAPLGAAVPPPAPPPAGWQTLRFETTPPLPSYLVAFAVGDFDLLDAGRVGELPLRVATPRGRADETWHAREITAPVVQRLEAYFDMPLPFSKIDSLAVPAGRGFGAMENPGLVTFAAPIMLVRPGQDSAHFRDNHLGVTAHELAHQWFGNLVTLAWWDDLWLNESFASWLGDRIAGQVQPGQGWELALLHARQQAMRVDRLPSTRAVQQAVRTDDDLGDLWNPITYDKGQALLTMLEAWGGEEAFRDAVRRFIGRHAWGNASTDDFLRALGEQDPQWPGLLRSFVQQPGIPLLRAELQCQDEPPRLVLNVSRLMPRGTVPADGSGGTAPATPWWLPLRVHTPGGQARLLMTTPQATLPLPDAQCPAWVQANVDASGYYRVDYRGSFRNDTRGDDPAPPGRHNLLQLADRTDLPLTERLTLLDDAAGLHEAGALDTDTARALVQSQAAQADAEVALRAVDLLDQLEQPLAQATGPGAEAGRAASATRWQQAFGERARALGWQPQPGESGATERLRLRLVPRMATAGQDRALAAQAIDRVRLGLPRDPADTAAAWPAEPLRSTLLASAARAAGADDEALFEQLLAAWRNATRRDERRALFGALAAFESPALARRARALALEPGTDTAEALGALMREQSRSPGPRAELLAWLVQHHARLVTAVGNEDAAEWPIAFIRACSADEARAIERGFSPHAARLPGGRKSLALALQTVAICQAQQP